MNVGLTELVIVLLIFAIPVAAVALVVIASRSGRRMCPACGDHIPHPMSNCPRCGAAADG